MIATNTTAGGGGSSYSTGSSFLANGTTYTLSAYVKTDSTLPVSTFEMGHADNGSAPTNVACLTAQTISLGWTRFTCTWTSGAITGNPYIYFKVTDNVNRNLYIDDVVLQTDANATANYRNATLNLQGTVVNSSLQIQTAQNNTNALQVQNTAGTQIFNVDTTDTNLITNPGFEVNSTGWAASGTGSIRRDTSQTYSGIASLKVVSQAAANSGAQYNLNPVETKASTTYTISWYALLDGSSAAFTDMIARYSPDGTATSDCSVTAMNSQTVVTGGWTRYFCAVSSATTPTTSGFIRIMQTGATAHTYYIDGVQLEQTAVSAMTNYAAGGISWNAVIQSPTTFKSNSNSTTAFQVQVSSGYNLLGVDTTNSVVKIYDGTSTGNYISLSYNDGTSTGTIAANTGTTAVGNGTGSISILAGSSAAITITANAASTWSTTAGLLTVQGNGGLTLNSIGSNVVTLDSTTTGNVNIGTGASAKTVAIGNSTGASATTITSGTGNITLTTNGSTAGTVIKSGTNSSAAFQVQNSAGTSFIAADTTNNIVTLDSSTGAAGNINIGNATGHGQNVDIGLTGSGGANNSIVHIANNTNASAHNTILIGSGGNAANILTLDAGNTGGINIGNTTSAHTINIGNGGTAAQAVSIGSTSSSSSVAINAASGNVLVNATGGAVTLQTTTSGAINIAPASVDGTNVNIGTSDTVGTLLVLDTKTGSGDPATCMNGGMYYNSNSGVFRACQNSSWVTMISAVTLNCYVPSGQSSGPVYEQLVQLHLE